MVAERKALFNLNNKTALWYFDNALAINGTDENAFFNRGAFLQSGGNYKSAIDNYEKALILNPKDEDARSNLALAESQFFGSLYFLSTFALMVFCSCCGLVERAFFPEGYQKNSNESCNTTVRNHNFFGLSCIACKMHP